MDRLPLVVNLLKAEDALRWDAFVQRCPQATFFHLSAWRDIMEEVFDHRTFYLYAERAGEIVGILPLAEVRSRLFGHSLTSLPFCVYGGIAAADDAGLETEHALEAKADTLAQALGVQHLEYRNLQLRHEDWPRQELYVTFRKAILAEPEANMLAIPRKQRAMVRKGIKNGLVSEIDHDLERFFALYADNVLRHGTPALPKKFFERLKHSFGEACEVLTVTSPEGKPLSSVLSFYFRDEVLPYYAGDDFSARDLAANDFKYWELMR
ncbi:MAG: FemAB family PEP-CTERM system-associated protein, partial [Thauera sp.]|nr:FemAB family PEP-CTERM system-associated protein [Thauera sp.]